MLGWHISVYPVELANPPLPPASPPDEAHERKLRDLADAAQVRIATWQAGLDGLRWIDELVTHGEAIALPGSGYPNLYFAPAKHLLPLIFEGPPGANAVWHSDPETFCSPNWQGQTSIDRNAAEDCSPDEWLLVRAWDES